MRGAAEGNLRSACVCSSYRCMGGWGVGGGVQSKWKEGCLREKWASYNERGSK